MFSIPTAISSVLLPPRFSVSSAMKIYCSCQGDKFQLPITPPQIEVTVQNNNTTVNINDVGEILMIGKSGLLNITIESFFPNQLYYFADLRFNQKPYSYVEKINKWKDDGKPMRLLLTSTPINKPFAIESFTYREEDGTGDVSFSLNLKEYKYLTEISAEVNEMTELKERPDERILENITVYPDDDVMDVAIRAVGATKTMWQYKDIARRGATPGDILGVRDGKISL